MLPSPQPQRQTPYRAGHKPRSISLCHSNRNNGKLMWWVNNTTSMSSLSRSEIIMKRRLKYLQEEEEKEEKQRIQTLNNVAGGATANDNNVVIGDESVAAEEGCQQQKNQTTTQSRMMDHQLLNNISDDNMTTTSYLQEPISYTLPNDSILLLDDNIQDNSNSNSNSHDHGIIIPTTTTTDKKQQQFTQLNNTPSVGYHSVDHAAAENNTNAIQQQQQQLPNEVSLETTTTSYNNESYLSTSNHDDDDSTAYSNNYNDVSYCEQQQYEQQQPQQPPQQQYYKEEEDTTHNDDGRGIIDDDIPTTRKGAVGGGGDDNNNKPITWNVGGEAIMQVSLELSEIVEEEEVMDNAYQEEGEDEEGNGRGVVAKRGDEEHSEESPVPSTLPFVLPLAPIDESMLRRSSSNTSLLSFDEPISEDDDDLRLRIGNVTEMFDQLDILPESEEEEEGEGHGDVVCRQMICPSANNFDCDSESGPVFDDQPAAMLPLAPIDESRSMNNSASSSSVEDLRLEDVTEMLDALDILPESEGKKLPPPQDERDGDRIEEGTLHNRYEDVVPSPDYHTSPEIKTSIATDLQVSELNESLLSEETENEHFLVEETKARMHVTQERDEKMIDFENLLELEGLVDVEQASIDDGSMAGNVFSMDGLFNTDKNSITSAESYEPKSPSFGTLSSDDDSFDHAYRPMNESGNDNSPSHVPSLTECLAEVRNYLVNSPDNISLDSSERSSPSEQLIMKYPGIENEESVKYLPQMMEQASDDVDSPINDSELLETKSELTAFMDEISELEEATKTQLDYITSPTNDDFYTQLNNINDQIDSIPTSASSKRSDAIRSLADNLPAAIPMTNDNSTQQNTTQKRAFFSSKQPINSINNSTSQTKKPNQPLVSKKNVAAIATTNFKTPYRGRYEKSPSNNDKAVLPQSTEHKPKKMDATPVSSSKKLAMISESSFKTPAVMKRSDQIKSIRDKLQMLTAETATEANDIVQKEDFRPSFAGRATQLTSSPLITTPHQLPNLSKTSARKCYFYSPNSLDGSGANNELKSPHSDDTAKEKVVQQTPSIRPREKQPNKENSPLDSGQRKDNKVGYSPSLKIAPSPREQKAYAKHICSVRKQYLSAGLK